MTTTNAFIPVYFQNSFDNDAEQGISPDRGPLDILIFIF